MSDAGWSEAMAYLRGFFHRPAPEPAPPPKPKLPTLLDCATQYIAAIEIADAEDRDLHIRKLHRAADEIAADVGEPDFAALCERGDIERISIAMIRSAGRFDAYYETAPADGRYWLAAYAVVHLMLLNWMNSLEDAPDAKSVAERAAMIYTASRVVIALIAEIERDEDQDE